MTIAVQFCVLAHHAVTTPEPTCCIVFYIYKIAGLVVDIYKIAGLVVDIYKIAGLVVDIYKIAGLVVDIYKIAGLVVDIYKIAGLVVDYGISNTVSQQAAFSFAYIQHRRLSGKLWYLQHICVGDTIVYHKANKMMSVDNSLNKSIRRKQNRRILKISD